MQTPHSNEHVPVLCALIAKEEDPGKFLLLVRELNDVLENRGVKFEHAQSTTATSHSQGAQHLVASFRSLEDGSAVSQIICCVICNKPLALEAPNVSVDENGQVVHTDCYVERLIAARNDPPAPHHAE
jgi:hypothetical protein